MVFGRCCLFGFCALNRISFCGLWISFSSCPGLLIVGSIWTSVLLWICCFQLSSKFSTLSWSADCLLELQISFNLAYQSIFPSYLLSQRINFLDWLYYLLAFVFSFAVKQQFCHYFSIILFDGFNNLILKIGYLHLVVYFIFHNLLLQYLPILFILIIFIPLIEFNVGFITRFMVKLVLYYVQLAPIFYFTFLNVHFVYLQLLDSFRMFF